MLISGVKACHWIYMAVKKNYIVEQNRTLASEYNRMARKLRKIAVAKKGTKKSTKYLYDERLVGDFVAEYVEEQLRKDVLSYASCLYYEGNPFGYCANVPIRQQIEKWK